ncbi:hypothetical protein ACE1AT_19575 [Pelatocladus sp. BLCC-F211]|uniref:hypothetical protein n=1 Tax=Pelatocladus sp. BLCC-F211 TaxID=3342752 RepID=UPI0035BABA37
MKNHWKEFFMLRPSSVFIIFFGILTGLIGYKYSQISENPSERDKFIWSYIFGSAAITISSIKWIDSIVSKEIEAKTNTNLAEKIDQEMNMFKNDYSKDIEDLKKEIDDLEIPYEQRQKIIDKFESIRSANNQFKVRRKADKEIANWLDIRDNKRILIEVAMDSVSNSKCQINDEYIHEIDKNIRHCIIWLRYSVEDGKARKFDPERYASAMIKVSPGIYEPYEIALNAIKEALKEQPKIKEFYKKTPNVEKMIQFLIHKIQELSETKK